MYIQKDGDNSSNLERNSMMLTGVDVELDYFDPKDQSDPVK